MKAKEAIIRAWMDLGVNAPFGICDKTGWSEVENENNVEKILKHHNISIDKIEFEYLEFAGLRYRPKSLQGIENNNGWIKIESEDNLPKDGNYWVFTKSGEIIDSPKYADGECLFNDNKYWIENFTHYQSIQKPLLPIY